MIGMRVLGVDAYRKGKGWIAYPYFTTRVASLLADSGLTAPHVWSSSALSGGNVSSPR
jgi:hypothetical protein